MDYKSAGCVDECDFVFFVSVDLNDRRMNTNLFTKLCDPDPLLLSMIHFYIRNFILQSTLLANCFFFRENSCVASLEKTTAALADYNRRNNCSVETEMSDCFNNLSNYLTEHVDNDLIPALFDKGTSIIQVATGRPESYSVNEDDGVYLNVLYDYRILCIVYS